jgi:hypothetical protein
MRAALIRSAIALAVFLSIAPASAGRITDYDLNKLNSWAEAIAVCDVTRFLLTDPDLSADVILVGGHDNSRVALYRPLFAPPTNFFSESMRETYENVHKAGLVTAEDYSRARIHYAQRMIDAYRNASLADKKFLKEQMELCYHLAARAGVKHIYREKLAVQ